MCQSKYIKTIFPKLDSAGFGAGSIDGLGMFSGMTTFSMVLSKGKRWARLFGLGKGWNYCMI